MNSASLESVRVLAIDPTSRGFGFAVMEGPELLVDWGVRSAGYSDKNSRCVQLIVDLIHRYQPDVLVVEDLRHGMVRRSPRVRDLIAAVSELAGKGRIGVRRFTTREIKQALGAGARNKEQIALEICKRLPELAPRLPHHRYPWMSEDYRTGIFDSVALALTYFHLKLQKRKDVLLDLGINGSNHAQ